MSRLVASFLICLASAPAFAEAPRTESEQTLYALGAVLGKKISAARFSPRELALIQRGFADAAGNRSLQLREGDLDEWAPKVEAMMAKRSTPEVEAEKARGAAFAKEQARAKGAVQTGSGLVFLSTRPGQGPSPAATDTVKVNYTGKLIDGTVFDSSAAHGGPASFRLDGVLPCWTEGVQRMHAGETARLVCPASIAYGQAGRPPKVPGGATLVFEVELLEVKK